MFAHAHTRAVNAHSSRSSVAQRSSDAMAGRRVSPLTARKRPYDHARTRMHLPVVIDDAVVFTTATSVRRPPTTTTRSSGRVTGTTCVCFFSFVFLRRRRYYKSSRPGERGRGSVWWNGGGRGPAACTMAIAMRRVCVRARHVVTSGGRRRR